ncbi:MAG: hypothetical protein ACJ786_42085 [Catenulispora sp.]
MERRTGVLFSSAVALGLAGGLGIGFGIQHARPATPLPPISHTLGSAVVPLAAVTPDPATDDGAKLDGDLRDLLLAKPAGAKDDALIPARGWLTAGNLAEYFGKPDQEFAALNAEHFRRAARAVWVAADGTRVEVDLVQFRTGDDAGSFFAAVGFPQDLTASAVAGTGTGYVGRYDAKGRDGMFTGYGLVRHGDVVEQVFLERKQGPPGTEDVMQVTKEQADRL